MFSNQQNVKNTELSKQTTNRTTYCFGIMCEEGLALLLQHQLLPLGRWRADTSIHVSSQPSISTAIQAITIHLPLRHQHALPFILLPHASHEQLYTDLHSTQHMMLVWSALITSYTTHAITKCQTITCIKINSDHMPRRITGYQTKPCNVYQTWKTQGTWVWYFKLNAGIL